MSGGLPTYTGIVKARIEREDKLFGFIANPLGGKDLYVQRSTIELLGSAFTKGTPVEFSIIAGRNPGDLIATNVVLVGPALSKDPGSASRKPKAVPTAEAPQDTAFRLLIPIPLLKYINYPIKSRH